MYYFVTLTLYRSFFICVNKKTCSKEYILNSFIRIYDQNKKKHRRLSEGPIEGINSQIQKIHMNSNGFTNFNRLKKVVIYKINKYLPYKF